MHLSCSPLRGLFVCSTKISDLTLKKDKLTEELRKMKATFETTQMELKVVML